MEGRYSEVLQNFARFQTINILAHYLHLRINFVLSGIDVHGSRVLT